MRQSFRGVNLKHHFMVGKGTAAYVAMHFIREPDPVKLAKGYTIQAYLDGWTVRDGEDRFVRFFKGPKAAHKASTLAGQFESAAR